jgi:NDP-sugar pyrophosphorylase family protein
MPTRIQINNKLEEIDVVILCGGMGSRLQAVISDRPKPMAMMDQKPFLEILIDYFSDFGLRRFILCAGYMSEIIGNYYNWKAGPLEFVISDEKVPLGTAGAIKNAQALIRSDPFLVTNGDSFCSVDLGGFFMFHSARQALMSMVVVQSKDTPDYGRVLLDESQRIVGFEEKKQGCGHTNAGVYLFQKQILSSIPANAEYSLEYDLFPGLVKKQSYAFICREPLIDIGTPERFETAKQFFGSNRKVLSS